MPAPSTAANLRTSTGDVHPFEAPIPLKRHSRERRYALRGRRGAKRDPQPIPRPQPPVRGGCCAAELEAHRGSDPVHASARPARARAGADGPRDRGPPARRGRARQPRDRAAALPLGGDGQVTRPASAREASSAQQSPRRSRWLPAWAHRVASTVTTSLRAKSGVPPKEGCLPGLQKRGSDGLPVLHAGGMAARRRLRTKAFRIRLLLGWELTADASYTPIRGIDQVDAEHSRDRDVLVGYVARLAVCALAVLTASLVANFGYPLGTVGDRASARRLPIAERASVRLSGDHRTVNLARPHALRGSSLRTTRRRHRWCGIGAWRLRALRGVTARSVTSSQVVTYYEHPVHLGCGDGLDAEAVQARMSTSTLGYLSPRSLHPLSARPSNRLRDAHEPCSREPRRRSHGWSALSWGRRCACTHR